MVKNNRALISDYVRQKFDKISFNSRSWIVLSDIEQRIKKKIENAGIPLKEWDIQINYGIKTGLNEAFIINTEKRKELIEKCSRSAEIIRPILRGRDIKRYKAEWSDLYIINVHTGYKSQSGELIPPIMINDYPQIKEHLDKYYTQLSFRQDKGISPYHLRSCIYMEDFYKQKIVWAEIARSGNAFTFDAEGYMVSNTGYVLTVNNGNAEMAMNLYRNLLAFLNSKAILFYLDRMSTRLDETGWRWLRQFVELLPIPVLLDKELMKIINLVDEQLIKTTAEGQNAIDNFVNETYCFTDEEVLFINNLH